MIVLDIFLGEGGIAAIIAEQFVRWLTVDVHETDETSPMVVSQ